MTFSRTEAPLNILSLPCREQKKAKFGRVKYWETIADNLSKAAWSWGYVSAIDSSGRTIWIADAHRGDGQRFVVRADELLTAFVELESTICRQNGITAMHGAGSRLKLRT
jgi:hypothetical protein